MVGIINYGAGNIFSVMAAIRHCGQEAFLVSDSESLKDADKIVLPGVGAFRDGMEHLERSGLLDSMISSVNGGKPFLGICLGLQLLFSHSEEGDCEGINLLPGMVRRFNFKMNEYKVPHIGWSRVEASPTGEALFKDIPPKSYYYFAHSYYVVPEDNSLVCGKAEYGGKFCSVVKKDNVVGVQFHPEKSGQNGLLFIKNFLEGKWLR